MIRALTCLALLALAACQGVVETEPRFSESRQEGISLALSVSPARISPGDTVRLAARLTNHTASPVRLTFGGCQVLFFVENAKGEMVEPRGGGWGCLAVITTMDLAPGETKTQEHRWTGQTRRYDPGTPRPVYDPLPAGSYRAYATVDAMVGEKRIMLRSNTETVELR